MDEKVFSDYEVKETSIKFEGEEGNFDRIGCVGSMEEAMNMKTIGKKCEGIVVKQVTKGDGTGELKMNLHMRYEHFIKMYGMDFEGLKDGVHAYGKNSTHRRFSQVCKVLDEEDRIKFKAYPRCVITSGKATKIENGAEEEAEMEVTIGIMPDDEGNGVYEALESELKDEEVKTKWMTDFTPELVKETTA